MILPNGVSMIGPILYTFGSEEQQERFLPGVRESTTWWCQGYSEPNAGSDLASLKTAAVLDGDHYVVNGTKMWTTEAHWADWMHCLVRTSSEGRPQQGITYLMIDMKSPGVKVEPIKSMDGVCRTNQTFLDNVKVPLENRIGGEGEGWKMARFLLDNERGSIADTGTKMFFLNRIERRLARTLETGVPDRVRHRLLEQFDDLRTRMLGLCALEKVAMERWTANTQNGLEGSLLKLRSTELYQAMGEFSLDVAGRYANSWDADNLSSGAYDPELPWLAPLGDLYHYLYGRAWTIFGGTSEIQRTLIARSLV